MRNFLAFIRRFQVLLIFALLQGVALSVYFTFKSFPRSQYLTTASAVSGSIYDMQHGVTQYLHLRENNTQLQKENARLRESRPESMVEMDRQWVKINDTAFMPKFEYIPAKVINSNYTKRNNYFTLDIGSEQGVERGMGVYSSNGVVGTIHNVGKYFSVVKSCLTENINIAVMIENSGEHGFLKWNGKDPRRGTLYGISNDSKVKKWSKVITRGSAGYFPEGIMVGKVEKTEVVEGKPLWDVTILFSENYRTVQRVYVIKNLLRDEQHALEAQIPKDPED